MKIKVKTESTQTIKLLRKDKYIWTNANSIGKPNRLKIIMKKASNLLAKRMRRKIKTRKMEMGKRSLFLKTKICSRRN